MASKIVKMVLKLDDKASPELKKVSGEAKTTTSGLISMKTGAIAAAAGLAAIGTAAVASIKVLNGLAVEMKDMVNTFGDMSGVTGLSTELLETFDFMAKSTGADIKKLERGFVNFGRGMSDAANGTGELNRVLETLPLAFDPSAFDTMDQKVLGFIQAVEGLEDAGAQAAAMTAAFGRSAIDLQKALNTGDVETYREELAAIGFVAGPEAVKATQRMQRATALQEIMMSRFKMAAFDALMGPDGYVSYLGATVGAMQVLGLVITDIWEATAGFAMTLFSANKAISAMNQPIPDFALAFKSANEAVDQFKSGASATARLLGGGGYLQIGKETADDFAATLQRVGKQSKSTADQQAHAAAIMAELEARQAGMEKGANKTTKAVKEEVDEWQSLIDAVSDSFDVWSGAEAGLERLTVQLEASAQAFDQWAASVEESLDLSDWGDSVLSELDKIIARLDMGMAGIEAAQQRRADSVTAGAAATTSLVSGDVAGAAGTIATAAGAVPMVGAVIGAIGAVAEIGEMTVKEIKSNARAFVTNLTNGIEVLSKALPDVISMLLKNLPAALIEAAFVWIPQLLLELPGAIASGFIDGFKNVMSLIFEGIKNLFSLRDPDKADKRTGLLDLIRVDPSEGYASGVAKVDRSGMALIHKGETIVQAGGRASQDQMSRIGGGGLTVNISTSIMDRDVIPRLVREIDRVTGNYGRTKANFARS